MKVNFQQLFKAIILAAFALVIVKLHVSGDITKFINPKYSMLSQIAAVIFLFLTIIQLVRSFERHDHTHEHENCDCTHDHEHTSFNKKLINYSIIIFPLITAFFFSPVILDSSIAAKKGTMFTKKNVDEQKNEPLDDLDNEIPNTTDNPESQNEDDLSNEEIDPYSNEEEDTSNQEQALENNNFMSSDEYNRKMEELKGLEFIHMKDDVYSVYYETMHMAPELYEGKRIKVIGFVYKEEGFSENELVVARFMISHCVADASIVGFLALLDDAAKLEQDTWLEIEGVIKLTKYNDMKLPAIVVDSWKEITEPEEPYIFPVLTSN
ncbi:TIGR03943 family protein [Lottiidibacillus patelloidae]|uniref:TIGR03943 family protein n=1 Tax=Lottiidibacillus patelloidae TaxID=2670334 RepID=A0A263BUI8_9BACI|nr:TIGR03943 family protein [Lottiidibacillus patelloidae]OZM57380.1 TIGR03943 family protein [Lottiidibacillus patelloidae]